MRIHTDRILRHDLANTALPEHVSLHILGEYGSRSHDMAYEVALRGHGAHHKRAPQHRITDDAQEFAATYEEWGWFLAEIFAADETAKAGPYRNARDFHAQTRYAFA